MFEILWFSSGLLASVCLWLCWAVNTHRWHCDIMRMNAGEFLVNILVYGCLVILGPISLFVLITAAFIEEEKKK